MRLLTFPACACGRGAGTSLSRGGTGAAHGPVGAARVAASQSLTTPQRYIRKLAAWPAEGEWLCREAALCPALPRGIRGPWPVARMRGWRERPSCLCPLRGALWAVVVAEIPLSMTLAQSLSWLCSPAWALCSQYIPAHLCLADALSLTTLS